MMNNEILRIARRYRLLAAFLVTAAILAACATQPVPAASDPPGFWSGLFHGFTIFFSLIGSLFTDNRIYSFPNSGGWYDFGYFLGASAFLGGGGAGAKARK
jgi:hypothetical protein